MKKIVSWLFICLILIQVIYVAYGIVQNPIATGDAYGIWFLKTKAIQQASNIQEFVGFLKDSNFAYSHPEYPLLLPLFLSIFGTRELVWMILYPILFSLIVFLVFDIVRNKIGQLAGLLAAFSVSTVMVLERLSGRGEVGFADLPLGFLYIFGFWAYSKNKINWPLMALIWGLAANMKQEGLLGAVLFAIVMRPKGRHFWSIFTPMIIIWPVATRFLGLNSIYQANFNLSYLFGNFDKVILIGELFINQIVNFQMYGLWLLIYIACLFLKTDTLQSRIKIWILMYLGLLAMSYIFTPLPLVNHWNSSFYRIISSVLPTLIANSFIMTVWNFGKKY